MASSSPPDTNMVDTKYKIRVEELSGKLNRISEAYIKAYLYLYISEGNGLCGAWVRTDLKWNIKHKLFLYLWLE
jgi:hypothetical protein